MRYISETIAQFSKEKFVLLSGPRQVGKTTLAMEWLDKHTENYLNWDIDEHRAAILKKSYLKDRVFNRLVLDELHKYRPWKNYLKGLFDAPQRSFTVLVTGSARLELFQHGGDSLFGRYEYLRLHPFSIGELQRAAVRPPPQDWLRPSGDSPPPGAWEALEKFSGFPEPFTKADSMFFRRWSARRRSLILRQEMRDISEVKELAKVEHLALLLPERVGSPLSRNSLREELQVSHESVTTWLELLERLYLCFSIAPYRHNLARAVKKERKYYLWNWADVPHHGACFENMVACHLLKSIHAWNDLGYGEYELMYLRDRDGKEVDFVVCERQQPLVLIEAKLTEAAPSPALRSFQAALKGIPAIQLIRTPHAECCAGNLSVMSAEKFFAGMT